MYCSRVGYQNNTYGRLEKNRPCGNYRCFLCNKPVHFKRDCPNREGDNSQLSNETVQRQNKSNSLAERFQETSNGQGQNTSVTQVCQVEAKVEGQQVYDDH